MRPLTSILLDQIHTRQIWNLVFENCFHQRKNVYFIWNTGSFFIFYSKFIHLFVVFKRFALEKCSNVSPVIFFRFFLSLKNALLLKKVLGVDQQCGVAKLAHNSIRNQRQGFEYWLSKLFDKITLAAINIVPTALL